MYVQYMYIPALWKRSSVLGLSLVVLASVQRAEPECTERWNCPCRLAIMVKRGDDDVIDGSSMIRYDMCKI